MEIQSLTPENIDKLKVLFEHSEEIKKVVLEYPEDRMGIFALMHIDEALMWIQNLMVNFNLRTESAQKPAEPEAPSIQLQ